jgi:uncharacterized protein YbjT (DUF2867 family)
MKSGDTILLTGATGFVGRGLWPALARQGYQVRCMTRDAESARARFPQQEWVSGDISRPEMLARALQGCQAAYYLVHGMAEGAPDFRRREVLGAECFAQAAREAGLERIVYLGGVAPAGKPSEHLLSRLEVGQTLRQGSVPTIELRASMIIGYGSLSWLIVRDLAARLPFMVLPRWLQSLTEPIGIDDVVVALTAALEVPLSGGQWFDIPGLEVLSCQQILVRTARLLGLKPPVMLQVPVLTPRLSSHWVRFVTRAEWSVAREVVLGLGSDLLSQSHAYWTLIGHSACCSFDEAARRALEAEKNAPGGVAGFWRRVEEGVQRWHGVGGAA